MKINQLHVVSRTQQSRQSTHNVKKFRSPRSTDFFEALRVEWRNTTPSFCLNAKAKKKTLINNNSFTPCGNRTHNRRVTVIPLSSIRRRPYLIVNYNMEKDKANERWGHLMVSDYRRPRPRATPEELLMLCFYYRFVGTYPFDGKEMIIHKYDDPATENFHFYDFLKSISIHNDVWVKHHPHFADEHYIIIDMSWISLKMIPKINIQYLKDYIVYLLVCVVVTYFSILKFLMKFKKRSCGAAAQSVTVKSTGCGFDPHLGNRNIYLHLFIFSFLRCCVKAKGGAEFHHSQSPPQLGGN